jgi:hypothetical protein
MFLYWQEYTYLGPDAEEKIALARRVTTGRITDFATWAALNMPVAGS